MKFKFFYLGIGLLFYLFTSCKQPWPDDIKAQLENGLVQSDVKKVLIELKGHSSYENMLSCIVTRLKNKYPDFRDFKKVLNDDFALKEEQKSIIPCMTNILGNNTDIIWFFFEYNPSFITIKDNLSPKQFEYFKRSVLSRFKAKYHTVENFLKTSIDAPSDVDQASQIIFSDCATEIKQQREEEERKLNKMASLFDETFYSYGTISCFNNSNVALSICLAYYYEGTKWKGWASHGWYNIEPGETININIPSSSGTLNRYFYYYAKGNNVEYAGSATFAVSGKAFKIANADKINVNDFSDFYLLKKFRKYDIGDYVGSNFTLTLN